MSYKYMRKSVSELKQHALFLGKKIKVVGWFREFMLRQELKQVLNEIEYQEGRLQYANRPYSFPSAVVVGPSYAVGNPYLHELPCRCGCWKKVGNERLVFNPGELQKKQSKHHGILLIP